MEVKTVRLGGLLDKQNQLQRDAAIQKGDLFLSVNGVHGDFDAMFAQFAKDSVVFEVTKMRPHEVTPCEVTSRGSAAPVCAAPLEAGRKLPTRQELEEKYPEAFADEAMVERLLAEVEEALKDPTEMYFPGLAAVCLLYTSPSPRDS